jgi:hypothetical protein
MNNGSSDLGRDTTMYMIYECGWLEWLTAVEILVVVTGITFLLQHLLC